MKLMMILCLAAVVLQLYGSESAANPFLGDWDTPFGVPPFTPDVCRECWL